MVLALLAERGRVWVFRSTASAVVNDEHVLPQPGYQESDVIYLDRAGKRVRLTFEFMKMHSVHWDWVVDA